jgi:DNA-directed RNA polymerase subunit M/transcription elongation factor TFIIS
MNTFVEETKAINLELACTSCGALLKFKPGTRNLACEYCGSENEIASPQVQGTIRETSLEKFLSSNFDQEEKIEVATVKCDGCHAISTFDAKTSSDKCPFCASPLVVRGGTTALLHKPQYVLPFGIDEKESMQNFKQWLKALWFAPNDLKHFADGASRLTGMYLPFWTFDCNTQTSYTGQRGEYYYVSESYSTVENGKSVTRTRQVRKTHWYPASGSVSNTFDDLLIEASTTLKKDKLRALEPWDLKNLVPFDDKYLSGFRTESYQVGVKPGYEEAKGRMEPIIQDSIRHDIGGDEQMIHYANTSYSSPSFKHILLPVWLSAYRYNDKVYQFLVNARTGEVQGDRPWSAAKIALAVIAALIFLAVVIMLGQR